MKILSKITRGMMLPFRFKRAIIKCFDDLGDYQTFTVGGGAPLTDNNGNNKFYGAKQVDETIRKLNRLLKLL